MLDNDDDTDQIYVQPPLNNLYNVPKTGSSHNSIYHKPNLATDIDEQSSKIEFLAIILLRFKRDLIIINSVHECYCYIRLVGAKGGLHGPR